MSEILICGGGICGLGAALLLARDGHEVMVLEGDQAPPPDSAGQAWEAWERQGVGQFHQPHLFQPGFRQILKADLPDIYEALSLAGAYRGDLLASVLAILEDRSPRPIDDQLCYLTARRPAAEWVFAHMAQEHPRIDLRRGVRVNGFVTGASVRPGIPHVTGVRTTDGDEIRADLVIDAMGRRSKNPQWLAAAGARAPEELAEDCGFTYYTRYFRGTPPPMIGPPRAEIGSISLLRLPGDHDTWSLTIYTASGDRPLKALRDSRTWTRVIQACPLQAPCLAGQPISEVLPIAGTMDRYRRFVLDGRPVATGFLAIADAWACTNPSAGRGITLGFKHAVRLRDLWHSGVDDPYALGEEFHTVTETEIAPWFWSQVAEDRARIDEISAVRDGRDAPSPADDLVRFMYDLRRFVRADPDIARAILEYMGTLTPIQVIAARPEVRDKLAALKQSADDVPPAAIPGPDRSQLLELVA